MGSSGINATHLENCANVKGGDDMINRPVLCSMASRLDASIGHIESLLKKYSMWDNTVVWAVSDNGGMNYWQENFPASASSNWPLRGGKTTVFGVAFEPCRGYLVVPYRTPQEVRNEVN